jgi:hypothetical protein
MPYIFLKEENQGNEDLVKIGDCQNRKNNLSKFSGNMSRVKNGPALITDYSNTSTPAPNCRYHHWPFNIISKA